MKTLINIKKESWNLKLVFGLMLLLFGCLNIQAQEAEPASVKVTARPQQEAVLLRWGVNTAIGWKSANEKGFNVYRRLVKKDSQIIENAPKVLLVGNLTTASQDLWEKEILEKNNQYAAIIAQAIFGESFTAEDTGEHEESELGRIINMVDELDQRFLFSLYAADMSYDASLLAGWGYVDQSVIKGEEYIYQVVVRGDDKIKSGATISGVDLFEALPVVNDFMGIAEDKKVMFGWSSLPYRNVFVAYNIEKSESENGIYKALSETAIVDLNANRDDGIKAPLMYYADTLAVNDRDYYYRISGITSFGEKGAPSKPIKIRGMASNETAPELTGFEYDNKGGVEIFWDFPVEKEKDIKAFELQVATDVKGEYTVLDPAIAKSKRRYIQRDLEASNYFKIAAVGLDDKRVLSMNVLVQPIDSIPPAIPTGLSGQIDSLGVVRLKWEANTEKDLLGYRIIRGQQKDEEFIDIYQRAYPSNAYTDSVNLKFANPKVYYRIAAEDKRHNVSEFSEILVLEKPVVIPPISPVFTDYKLKSGTVELHWINSPSDQVILTVISRRKSGESTWKTLKTFTDGTASYLDGFEIVGNQVYEYKIQAKNAAELWSKSGDINTQLTIEALDLGGLVVIKGLEAVVDREKNRLLLKWRQVLGKDKLVNIEIYKNVVGAKPILWQVVDGEMNEFILDEKLSMNTTYEYYLVPNLKDGIGRGEKITVTF